MAERLSPRRWRFVPRPAFALGVRACVREAVPLGLRRDGADRDAVLLAPERDAAAALDPLRRVPPAFAGLSVFTCFLALAPAWPRLAVADRRLSLLRVSVMAWLHARRDVV